jgi:hypothetical protein
MNKISLFLIQIMISLSCMSWCSFVFMILIACVEKDGSGRTAIRKNIPGDP